MNKLKIVYTGAGSAAWALTIVRDLAVSRHLSSSEVVLVDINEDNLSNSYKLLKRYIDLVKGKIIINKTTNLEEALVDSDYIINSVLANPGHVLQEKVREVSEKYGYYRGIESRAFNMVSDYATTFAAFEQYNFILNLAEKIHDISPEAWLINVANPMLELQTLLIRRSSIKSVSYCDGTLGPRYVASFMGLDPDKTEMKIAGLNHNVWLTEMRYNGEDQYNRIDEWVKNESEKYWNNESFYNTFDSNINLSEISSRLQFSRAAVDMYLNYGNFPIEDTVRSGTWKYHYNLDTKKKWYDPYGGFDSEIGWSKYLHGLEVKNNHLRYLSTASSEEILKEVPPQMGEDPVIPIIESLSFQKEIKAHLDVKNSNGDGKIIEGLPEDVAVEVSVKVDKNGIHPESVTNLSSKVVKYVLIARLIDMEMALDAYESGDKDILLDILYRDPRTKSDEQAETVLEKVLSIPENKGAREHYK